MKDRPTMTILCDSREQRPFMFTTCESKHFRHVVKTVGLPEGDYSIDDGETDPGRRIIVERKSLADLYGSLGVGRARFEREFERLSHYGYAALIIEASFTMILDPNKHLEHFTAMHPSAVLATLVAWSMHDGVHVWPCTDRRFAERLTFRLLERHLRDRLKERAECVAVIEAAA